MYRILTWDRAAQKWTPTGPSFGNSRANWRRVQRYQQFRLPAGVIVHLP